MIGDGLGFGFYWVVEVERSNILLVREVTGVVSSLLLFGQQLIECGLLVAGQRAGTQMYSLRLYNSGVSLNGQDRTFYTTLSRHPSTATSCLSLIACFYPQEFETRLTSVADTCPSIPHERSSQDNLGQRDNRSEAATNERTSHTRTIPYKCSAGVQNSCKVAVGFVFPGWDNPASFCYNRRSAKTICTSQVLLLDLQPCQQTDSGGRC